LVRQRAGRTSLWMLQFLRMWRNSRRVGPRSRWTKVHEGAIPSVRTNLSRRGWNSRHGGLKPLWASLPVPVRLRPPRPFCGRAWNSRPGGLKNRCAARRVSVQVAPAAPDFSASGGVDTHESQKLAGESPCRCESCLADQFAMATSNKSSSPVSQAGHRSAILRVAATLRRVVQSEPSAL
jgi:hypothetical protein